jgi:predicted metal-dependent phosphoesterase TrpH
VRTLALTDHDTLGGLGEAAVAAERLGLRFVPGTELSVRPPSGSMHLLAYLPSAAAEPLATRIREIGDYRASRNQRIVARLNELGYKLEWEDVARRARGRVGRPHIAAALVDAGHVATLQEAFDRLLADGQPAYVDAGSLGPDEAVELVERRRAGTRAPVLAAPGRRRARALRRRAGGPRAAGRRVLPAGSRRRAARVHDPPVRAARPRADRRIRLAWHRGRTGAGRFRAGADTWGHARAARSCMSMPSC